MSLENFIDEGGTIGEILGLREESRTVRQRGESLMKLSKSWKYHIHEEKKRNSTLVQ
jgi:hypothetical protein